MSDDNHSVDRLGLEILTYEECWQLLTDTPIGRIAFFDSGSPEILPVTHAVTGGRIVFRSVAGTKLDNTSTAPVVAFEVDGWNAEARCGWSVMARGTAESAPLDADELDALGLVPWVDEAAGGTWISIRVDEISGRRLTHPSS